MDLDFLIYPNPHKKIKKKNLNNKCEDQRDIQQTGP